MRLLDLPDEALELLEDGALTEGHGRALLLAATTPTAAASPATAAERRLVGARDRGAGPRGERRARPRRERRGAPADAPRPAEAAERDRRDALGGALGTEVKVARAAATGYRVELAFDDARRGARAGAARDRAAPRRLTALDAR